MGQLQRHQGIIILSLIALIVIGGGFLFYRRSGNGGALEITLPTPTSFSLVKVYVSGAVANPGVYSLSGDDRLDDVLRMAGATADADLSKLNLAARVQDEQHILVSKVGESPPYLDPSGKININTAPACLLATLPGIGEVTSQRIVDYRTQNGPFVHIEELREVKLLSAATFDQVKNLITAD
ncbi:MAG: ComEA family DNA-binding protein [Chloroflexi bacterium]|nr:ComEA family DNA-binding protein [Chloroflexota bacterium]